MKLELYNGEYVGTAEWKSPGRVDFDMEDDARRAWLERYFSQEDTFLTGEMAAPEMSCERRDASPEAFQRACFRLASYSYTIVPRTSSGN